MSILDLPVYSRVFSATLRLLEFLALRSVLWIFKLNHCSGCDIDAPEQRQINGEQSSRDTPLLACIRSDFDDVALCLIERGARLDRKVIVLLYSPNYWFLF